MENNGTNSNPNTETEGNSTPEIQPNESLKAQHPVIKKSIPKFISKPKEIVGHKANSPEVKKPSLLSKLNAKGAPPIITDPVAIETSRRSENAELIKSLMTLKSIHNSIESDHIPTKPKPRPARKSFPSKIDPQIAPNITLESTSKSLVVNDTSLNDKFEDKQSDNERSDEMEKVDNNFKSSQMHASKTDNLGILKSSSTSPELNTVAPNGLNTSTIIKEKSLEPERANNLGEIPVKGSLDESTFTTGSKSFDKKPFGYQATLDSQQSNKNSEEKIATTEKFESSYDQIATEMGSLPKSDLRFEALQDPKPSQIHSDVLRLDTDTLKSENVKPGSFDKVQIDQISKANTTEILPESQDVEEPLEIETFESTQDISHHQSQSLGLSKDFESNTEKGLNSARKSIENSKENQDEAKVAEPDDFGTELSSDSKVKSEESNAVDVDIIYSYDLTDKEINNYIDMTIENEFPWEKLVECNPEWTENIKTGSILYNIGPKAYLLYNSSNSKQVYNKGRRLSKYDSNLNTFSTNQLFSVCYERPIECLKWDDTKMHIQGNSNLILSRLRPIIFSLALGMWNELLIYNRSQNIFLFDKNFEKLQGSGEQDNFIPEIIEQFIKLGTHEPSILKNYSKLLKNAYQLVEMLELTQSNGSRNFRFSLRRWSVNFQSNGDIKGIELESQILPINLFKSLESSGCCQYPIIIHLILDELKRGINWNSNDLSLKGVDINFTKARYNFESDHLKIIEVLENLLRNLEFSETESKNIISTILSITLLSLVCNYTNKLEKNLHKIVKQAAKLIGISYNLLETTDNCINVYFIEYLCLKLYTAIHNQILDRVNVVFQNWSFKWSNYFGGKSYQINIYEFPTYMKGIKGDDFGIFSAHLTRLIAFSISFQRIFKTKNIIRCENMMLPTSCKEFQNTYLEEKLFDKFLSNESNILKFLTKLGGTQPLELINFIEELTDCPEIRLKKLESGDDLENNYIFGVQFPDDRFEIEMNTLSKACLKSSSSFFEKTLRIFENADNLNGLYETLNYDSLTEAPIEIFVRSLIKVLPHDLNSEVVVIFDKENQFIPWPVKYSDFWDNNGFPLCIRVNEIPRYCKNIFELYEQSSHESVQAFDILSHYLDKSDFVIGDNIILLRSHAYQLLIDTELQMIIQKLKPEEPIIKSNRDTIPLSIDMQGVWRGLVYTPKNSTTTVDDKSTIGENSNNQNKVLNTKFHSDFLRFSKPKDFDSSHSATEKSLAKGVKVQDATDDYLTSWELINLKGKWTGDVEWDKTSQSYTGQKGFTIDKGDINNFKVSLEPIVSDTGLCEVDNSSINTINVSAKKLKDQIDSELKKEKEKEKECTFSPKITPYIPRKDTFNTSSNKSILKELNIFKELDKEQI